MDRATYPRTIVNDRQRRMLDIVWDDSPAQRLPHALLRAQCKCTVCQSQRLLATAMQVAPAVPPSDVRIEEIRQVGVYGVQLVFSDGHERGIYPWDYLRTITSTPGLSAGRGSVSGEAANDFRNVGGDAGDGAAVAGDQRVIAGADRFVGDAAAG